MTRTYRRRTLVLGLFAQDFPQRSIIEDKVFEDCTLVGPAVAMFKACTFTDSHFGVLEDVESILWEIPVSRIALVGALLFRGCIFTGCKFEGVGIVSSDPTELSRWRAQLGAPLPEPPDSA
jgi:hypothetical protein